MIKGLHCPTCGDKWSRVFHESYLRLGPPKRECRACWAQIPTGAQEWVSMTAGSRIGFFMQNLITLVIPFLILVTAIAISYFEGLVDPQYLGDFFVVGVRMLGAMLLLLWAWAGLKVFLSLRRSAARPTPTQTISS